MTAKAGRRSLGSRYSSHDTPDYERWAREYSETMIYMSKAERECSDKNSQRSRLRVAMDDFLRY